MAKRDRLERRRAVPRADAVPLIRLEGIAKRFGKVVAVDDVTLDIYEREFFCLLGPSGCGKTTLMRLIAGFETPDRGRILLGGADLAAVAPHRRPVNMMFQSYALFPHMTVAGNVGFGLRQERLAKDEIDARVSEMLRLVQMEDLAGRRPDQLSGGQKQRVALARALAKRPKVLLLDEPLAALDKKLRQETQRELIDIQLQLGTTFLVVTHDQGEAMTMADRIGVMDRGELVQVASPAEVYEEPATRYVAAFIGDVNLFEGKIVARGAGGWRIATPVGELVIESDQALTEGQAVAVAVRPEKLGLQQDAPGEAGSNVIAGVVWDIGYLGDWTTYAVKLKSGAILRVAQANTSRRIKRPISFDDEVHVSFAADAGVILTR